MKPTYLSLEPLIPWREAERPIRWEERFGREAPLELEIGFGNGTALIERATANPERNFVGVELFWESIKRALRRTAQEEVPNIRLLLGNAGTILDHLFAPRSLSRVTSLFPCPWPKERHLRHRLFSHGFLRTLNGLLSSGGEVQVVTDFEAYLDWIRHEAEGTGFALEWEEVPARYGTKYERKWSELGQTRFFEVRLTKKDEIALPPKEEIDLEIHKVGRFDPELSLIHI